MAEKREWPEMAEWFDELQGDGGDFWHRSIIFPGILKVIGQVTGLHTLDLGCGNGSLARILARRGNRVVGVDASAPIIERARMREAADPLGIEYHAISADNLRIFPDRSFDLAVSCMALLDMPNAEGALREMGRVVRDDGRCVILIEHPCFDVPGSSWLIEKAAGEAPRVSRRVARYRETFSDWFTWSQGNGAQPQTLSYHRPLSWYFHALRGAGLAVTDFDEPEPTPEFLAKEGGEWLKEIPMHCVIEARRLHHPRLGESNGRG